MLRNKVGEHVKGGFYWNAREWALQVIPREGGTLRGEPGTVHYRLPLLVMLVVAPLMGAAYAMFLPFLGFAMVAMYLAGRLRKRPTPPAAEAEADAPTLRKAA